MEETDLEKRRAKRLAERKHKQAIYRKRRIGVAIIFIILIILIITFIRSCGSSSVKSGAAFSLDTNSSPAPTATPEPTFYDPHIENDLIKITDAIEKLHPDDKVCYLTFDDGPSEKVTPQILDVLDDYGINATFFVTGTSLKENPEVAKDAYKRGNLLANHSVTHKYSTIYASKKACINEFNSCEAQILNIVNADERDSYFKLIRFPGGVFNTTADSYSSVKLSVADELIKDGYFYVNWNALTGDAEGGYRDVDSLLAYMKRYLPDDKAQVVLLMHDTDQKQSTADALPEVIKYFMDKGYQFGRLDGIPYYTDVEDYLKEQKEKSSPSPSPSAKASSKNSEND